MIEPYFIELPIYRCSQEQHTKEMNEIKAKEINQGVSFFNSLEEFKEKAPESYNRIVNTDSLAWYPWKYNDIIGYLCLYIFGNQLRGDLWLTTANRINKGISKKKIICRSKYFETYLPKGANSTEIGQFVKSYTTELKNNDDFLKKRFLDDSQLQVLREYIDWRKLILNLNSF